MDKHNNMYDPTSNNTNTNRNKHIISKNTNNRMPPSNIYRMRYSTTKWNNNNSTTRTNTRNKQIQSKHTKHSKLWNMDKHNNNTNNQSPNL